jgi:hypothetical protein
MSMSIRRRTLIVIIQVVFSLCLSIAPAAQTPYIPNRITGAVDNQKTMTVHGTIPPLVRKSTDLGRLPGDRNLGQMLLMLSPAAEQNAAFDALIEEMHTPSSPNYHHWLSPAEIGARFGISEQDAATVQQWLLSQGFDVKRVAASRRFISFSGTVGQVESAFHTEMHQFDFKGQTFIANSTEIQIPAALSSVVRGVVRLSSSPKNSNAKIAGEAKYDKSRQQITFTNGQHAITPADFATIYNLGPLYQAGINGSGQSLAIVARSDIQTSDVFEFLFIFGLPSPNINFIVNGDDPGFVPGSDVEATLDLTWALALAPGSTANLVVSQSNFADGVDISAAYIVDTDLAPVMSTSFGICEQNIGPVGSEFYYSLWAQAAAEGITPVVSADDSGGADCDNPASGFFAQHGLAVNALASTPFNVAVGGTQFDDTANPSLYWSQTNDPTTKASVLSYIPEKVWNESSIDANNVNLFAGGGGVSTLWKKPDWQIGAGVPNDGMRDLPDVALTAASHDGYVLCLGGSCENGQVIIVAGTSASAPAFAAIMTLVNQQTGSPQGNPNYVLYQLAAQHPEIFHDITNGDNKVPDANGNFTVGYDAGPGYDLASGLGSFDANALVTNWNDVQFSGTSVALTGPASGSTFVHGTGVPLTASVTAASGGIPTGNVAFSTDNPLGTSASLGVGVAPLDSTGTVNVSLAAIPGGTHAVTARYAGNAKLSANTSNPVTVTITPEPSQTQFAAAVGGSLLTSTTAAYGEPLVLAILVQGNSGVGFPTGSVTLNEGSNVLGSRVLNFGEHENTQQGSSSVFGIFGFPAGLHLLTAQYFGDPSFNASTSSNLQLTVTKSDSSVSFHLQGSSIPNVAVPVFGRIALSTGAVLPISGAVAFSATSGTSSINLGTLTVDTNSGTFAGSFTFPTAGTWVIAAVYSGDSNVNAAQTAQQVTVDSSEATSMTLTSSAPMSPVGGSIAFTAQVSSAVTLKVPTGTVTFMDGSTSLGTVTLDSSGIAKLATTGLSGGTHSVTANYSGDAVFRPSSASVGENISDYTLQAVTASVSIKVGQSGTASVAVIPVGGFSQTVSFACSGLPKGAGCTFSPPSLTPDGTNIATDTMTISSSGSAAARLHSAAATRTLWLSGSGFGLVAISVLLPMCGRKRRSRMAVLGGIVLILPVLGMLGCGGSSASSAPPANPMVGTFSVTVTATAPSSPSRSVTVSVAITQ